MKKASNTVGISANVRPAFIMRCPHERSTRFQLMRERRELDLMALYYPCIEELYREFAPLVKQFDADHYCLISSCYGEFPTNNNPLKRYARQVFYRVEVFYCLNASSSSPAFGMPDPCVARVESFTKRGLRHRLNVELAEPEPMTASAPLAIAA